MNLLSKATSQSKFVFHQFNFLVGHKAPKKCLRFAIFNCSEKLQNHFEIGLKNCGVIIQKSLPEKKYFEISSMQTLFSSVYVKLGTVQIWGQSNKFLLSYNSLKCLLQEKKLFQKSISFANKPRPQTSSTGLSDSWASQDRYREEFHNVLKVPKVDIWYAVEQLCLVNYAY